MLLAIAWVLVRLQTVCGPPKAALWLLAALTASCVGDVLLMMRNAFVPGLIAFLCAHLAYIALLRSDAPLLARPRVVMGTLAGMMSSGDLITEMPGREQEMPMEQQMPMQQEMPPEMMQQEMMQQQMPPEEGMQYGA
jgi:hypothetical protein